MSAPTIVIIVIGVLVVPLLLVAVRSVSLWYFRINDIIALLERLSDTTVAKIREENLERRRERGRYEEIDADLGRGLAMNWSRGFRRITLISSLLLGGLVTYVILFITNDIAWEIYLALALLGPWALYLLVSWIVRGFK